MLKPRKRVKRKEIKQDPLVTTFLRVQKIYRRHQKKVSIGFVVVILIIALAIWLPSRKGKAEEAGLQHFGLVELWYYHFLQAESPTSQSQPQKISLDQIITELEFITTTYPGTEAACLAFNYLGNIYFDLGNYQEALIHYQEGLNAHKGDLIYYTSSLSGIAACYENKQEYNKAASYFEKAWKKQPDSFIAPYYLHDAGRCYTLAGMNDRARIMYDRIQDSYPQSKVGQLSSFLSELL